MGMVSQKKIAFPLERCRCQPVILKEKRTRSLTYIPFLSVGSGASGGSNHFRLSMWKDGLSESGETERVDAAVGPITSVMVVRSRDNFLFKVRKFG